MMDAHALMCVFKARAQQVQMWNVWKENKSADVFLGALNNKEPHGVAATDDCRWSQLWDSLCSTSFGSIGTDVDRRPHRRL